MKLLERLRALADALPDGASVTLPAAELRRWIADDAEASDHSPEPSIVAEASAEEWRARFWTCPPDTRLGVRELAEAVGRSADWVYRAVSAERATERGRDPLPCARLDGVLVFQAGAVRRWLQSSEQVVQPERRAMRAVR